MSTKTPKAVYIACTPDQYELPFAVADNAKELGSMIGVPENIVHQMISRKKQYDRDGHKMKGGRFRLYKVILIKTYCPVCGSEFEPRNLLNRYCSRACRKENEKAVMARRKEEKDGLQGRDHCGARS